MLEEELAQKITGERVYRMSLVHTVQLCKTKILRNNFADLTNRPIGPWSTTSWARHSSNQRTGSLKSFVQSSQRCRASSPNRSYLEGEGCSPKSRTTRHTSTARSRSRTRPRSRTPSSVASSRTPSISGRIPLASRASSAAWPRARSTRSACCSSWTRRTGSSNVRESRP